MRSILKISWFPRVFTLLALWAMAGCEGNVIASQDSENSVRASQRLSTAPAATTTAPVSSITTFIPCVSDQNCRAAAPYGLKPTCATGGASIKCVNYFCVGLTPTMGTTCFPGEISYCDHSQGAHPDCDPPTDGGVFIVPIDASACGTRQCVDNGAGICTLGVCNAP